MAMTSTKKHTSRPTKKTHGTAKRALAEQNAAALAPLDALREQLVAADDKATWGDVGAASDLVQTLSHAYASRRMDLDSGDTFRLPLDGGRDGEIEFTLEGF